MQLSVHFENTQGSGDTKGPVTVGWFLNQRKGGIIYAPPERVRSVDQNKSHAKSASRCPAVINLESRYFVVRCPFDLNLAFVRDKDGRPGLHSKTPMPGTIFGGRFPINVWPRPLMWAFEWHDTDQPLKINRGDPLFYATFETMPQDRSVVLVEADVTPELTDYMELISGAVNYVNQTFSLFEAAEAQRPKTLVSPKPRQRET